MEWLERTHLLVGDEGLEKLKNANVLVVGLGGVGAYAAEMICRAGVGKMTIVDGDTVSESNRNRQLPALISNLGKPKAEILGERFLDINPELQLTIVKEFIYDENLIRLLQNNYDYVVDAIDTLVPKTYLVYHSLQNGLPIVSSMGAGGRYDPTQIQVSDISKSYGCKLARMLRKRLGKLGVKKGFKVVFSPEEIDESAVRLEESQNKKSAVGTISYLPPAFGITIASVVLRDILEHTNN